MSQRYLSFFLGEKPEALALAKNYLSRTQTPLRSTKFLYSVSFRAGKKEGRKSQLLNIE